MAPKPKHLVGYSEALALMQLPKVASPPDHWREDLDHHGTSMMAFGLRVVGRRDLSVEITARSHPVIAGRKTVEFGLFKSDPIFRGYDRVYQLALDDPRFITHREPDGKAVYGSHELIGDFTEPLPDCNGKPFNEMLDIFLAKINLTLEDGSIEDPFAITLK